MLSRLLEETDYPTTEAIDLFTILRHLTETPPPSQTPDSATFLGTIAEKDAQIAARDETIRLLQEPVAALEEICRAQSRGTKRRYDDQEDPDGHEGEKRLRIESSSAAATYTSEQSTVQLKAGSTPHHVEPHVEPIKPTGQDEGTMTELTSAEVSMDAGPMVENPAGGDTEMFGDDDDDTTEGWLLINLDASQSVDTDLVINERSFHQPPKF